MRDSRSSNQPDKLAGNDYIDSQTYRSRQYHGPTPAPPEPYSAQPSAAYAEPQYGSERQRGQAPYAPQGGFPGYGGESAYQHGAQYDQPTPSPQYAVSGIAEYQQGPGLGRRSPSGSQWAAPPPYAQDPRDPRTLPSSYPYPQADPRAQDLYAQDLRGPPLRVPRPGGQEHYPPDSRAQDSRHQPYQQPSSGYPGPHAQTSASSRDAMYPTAGPRYFGCPSPHMVCY